MYIPLTFEGALQKCLIASSSYQGTFISGGIQYGFHIITGSSQLEVYEGSLQAQLVVVGGGGGGGSNPRASGGGGGGEVQYFPLQQFYKGVYNISVGAGGTTSGGNGGTTSITGPGLSISAVGGNGAFGSTGGTSGNGFSGGTGCNNVSGNGGCGGGGGGSTAAAANANCAQPTDATNGGAGFSIVVANTAWSFGCGGGGGASNSSGRGQSCLGGYGASDAGDPNTGNGGGGGWVSGGTTIGGPGGSGVVIIQYPIETYCKNFFNQTGSCNCSQITFNIPNGGQYPQLTGSYAYTQCGTNTLVSGSLKAKYPVTVCAVSNSWYWQLTSNQIGGQDASSGLSSGNNCFSASYGVQTCVTQSFPPTCTSKIITFYAGTGSAGPQTLFYIAKNESNFTYNTISNNSVTYKCVSSGSLYSGSIAYYPNGISGNGSLIFTSSVTCNNVTFISNAAFSTRYYKYQTCGGALVTGTFFGTGNSLTACVDTTFFYGFYNGNTSGTSVTVGGDCLSGSIDTGSCGCP